MTAQRSPLVTMLLTAGVVLAVGLPVLYVMRGPAEAEADVASLPDFEFEGIATTHDAQSLDQLDRALDTLRDEAPSLGAEEFKTRALGLTLAYLQFDGPEQVDRAARFVTVVDQALAEIDGARAQMEAVNAQAIADTQGDVESDESILARREAWGSWQVAQRDAGDLLLTAMIPCPRHGLLAEQRLIWLLRLDYGIRAGQRGDREGGEG